MNISYFSRVRNVLGKRKDRTIEREEKSRRCRFIFGNLRGKIMRWHVGAINKDFGRSCQVFGRTGNDIVMLMGDRGNIR